MPPPPIWMAMRPQTPLWNAFASERPARSGKTVVPYQHLIGTGCDKNTVRESEMIEQHSSIV